MGAAIGVAFVSATLSLGISLGINFAETIRAPHGPDLLQILQQIGGEEIPKDIRTECFHGIKISERPKRGDWIAVWGGECTTQKCRTILINKHLPILDSWPFSLQNLPDCK